MSAQNGTLLTRAWRARNRLYEDLFGTPSYSLPREKTPPMQLEPGLRRNWQEAGTAGGDLSALFAGDLSGQRIAVNAYEPNDQRPYWMYLTAGLSNPWFAEEPDDVSGFGCELMVKAPKDSRWAVRLLRRLSYYILSYTGTLSPGVILNMQTPIDSKELNNVFVWYADEAPDCWYQLPSGGFGVFCTVGITEDECEFAESMNEYGCWSIQEVLRKTGVGQVTNPSRGSVMTQNDIGSILNLVRAYAENFRPVP